MVKNGKGKYKHNADLYSIMYDTFIAFIVPNITISLYCFFIYDCMYAFNVIYHL